MTTLSRLRLPIDSAPLAGGAASRVSPGTFALLFACLTCVGPLGCTSATEASTSSNAIEVEALASNFRVGKYQAIGNGAMMRLTVEAVSETEIEFSAEFDAFNQPVARSVEHLRATIRDGSRADFTFEGCPFWFWGLQNELALFTKEQADWRPPSACGAPTVRGLASGPHLYDVTSLDPNEAVYVNSTKTATVTVMESWGRFLIKLNNKRFGQRSWRREFEAPFGPEGKLKTEVSLIEPTDDCNLTVRFGSNGITVVQEGGCVEAYETTGFDHSGEYRKY